MKKIVILSLSTFLLVFFSCPSFAAKDQKGASEKAYEHASDNSVFNRVSDWFATVGKSDEEKQKILSERKTERLKKQAQKKAKEMAAEGEKEMKEGKKKAEKSMQDVQKKRQKGGGRR